MTDTAARRYSTGAMTFHWAIALAVIANWRIAEAAEGLPDVDKFALFANHKALGMVIFALTLSRILWRWSHPVPALPSDLKPWEARLARTMHLLFYVLLVALPLGGWLASSFGGRPIDIFGLFTVPTLPVGENKGLSESIYEAHATGASIFLLLIALHVLGALKHTFIDKNGGIFRMLPFGRV